MFPTHVGPTLIRPGLLPPQRLLVHRHLRAKRAANSDVALTTVVAFWLRLSLNPSECRHSTVGLYYVYT